MYKSDIRFIPKPEFAGGKLSRVQKAGLSYEKKVCAQLDSIAQSLGWKGNAHQWIQYTVNTRTRIAQPDYFLISPSGATILFEIKLTDCDTTDQRQLYTTLLSGLGFNPITSITVCKNLSTSTPTEKIITDFNDLTQDSIWQLRK